MDKREQLAQEFSKQFETAKRPDGEDFTKLKEPRPQWMVDAVHAAHEALCCGTLPVDWIYSACREAADALADRDPDDWEEDAGNFAATAVEANSAQLYMWAADHRAFRGLIEEVRNEFGHGETHEQEIETAQRLAYERVYHAIREAIEEQAENEDE